MTNITQILEESFSIRECPKCRGKDFRVTALTTYNVNVETGNEQVDLGSWPLITRIVCRVCGCTWRGHNSCSSCIHSAICTLRAAVLPNRIMIKGGGDELAQVCLFYKPRKEETHE